MVALAPTDKKMEVSTTRAPRAIAGRGNNRYSTLNGAARTHACAMGHAARPVEMAA